MNCEMFTVKYAKHFFFIEVLAQYLISIVLQKIVLKHMKDSVSFDQLRKVFFFQPKIHVSKNKQRSDKQVTYLRMWQCKESKL